MSNSNEANEVIKKCSKEYSSQYQKQYRYDHKNDIKEYHKKRNKVLGEKNRAKSDSQIFDGTMKRCPHCKKEKARLPEHWVRCGINIDGLHNECRQCSAYRRNDLDERHRDANKKKLDSEIFDGTIKKCFCCKKEKPRIKTFWMRRGRSNDGLYELCKQCCKKLSEQSRKNNYEINVAKHDSQIFDETMKKCSRCKNEFPRNRECWHRYNSTLDGLTNICKQCENEKFLNRFNNNIYFKLRKTISNTICAAIKESGGSKNGSSILEKLPYTIQQLKDHLESLWEPWMNWDNWGKYDPNRETWQIDHKIPQSKFKYFSIDDPEFLKCWALNNLIPMRAIDNIKKSNKIDL